MRIIAISDTHSMHGALKDIPDGDVLVHAGDHCGQGRMSDVIAFLKWFEAKPHKHKVFIAGNHDGPWQKTPALCHAALEEHAPSVHYLQDSQVVLAGYRFHGSPWQPEFMDWSFNLPRDGEEIEARWQMIPLNTDVLITHGPPYGILDKVGEMWGSEHVGCRELMKRVPIVKPQVHIFGHIHEGFGHEIQEGIRYYNASTCTEDYKPKNPITVIDL